MHLTNAHFVLGVDAGLDTQAQRFWRGHVPLRALTSTLRARIVSLALCVLRGLLSPSVHQDGSFHACCQRLWRPRLQVLAAGWAAKRARSGKMRLGGPAPPPSSARFSG